MNRETENVSTSDGKTGAGYAVHYVSQPAWDSNMKYCCWGIDVQTWLVAEAEQCEGQAGAGEQIS